MDVILKIDVDGLGIVGEVVKVNDGYARNYLMPKLLAEPVSEAGIKRLEKARAARAFELLESLEKATKLAERFRDYEVSIPVKVAEEDKLYGSVTAAEIVKAAKDQKISIEKDQVLLDGPIKELGVQNVAIRLHPQVKATLKVSVVAE